MPNGTDHVESLLTDVVGAVGDVEKTLKTAPSHEKKAAAMTALHDAIHTAEKKMPAEQVQEVKSITSKLVDLVVALKHLLGHFTKGKDHAISAKKSA
jgi:hypothetical protein